MEEPVTTEAGFTYEMSALEDHIKTNGFVEPITRQYFDGKYFHNLALKLAIEHFLEENPWAFEFTEG